NATEEEVKEIRRLASDPTLVILDAIPGMIGQRSFVLNPRIGDRLFYIKVTFLQSQGTGQLLLVLSSHPKR
ncbi:MAG: hypothetical protein RLZZ458_29, partial [Planctomycetota bacterium]